MKLLGVPLDDISSIEQYLVALVEGPSQQVEKLPMLDDAVVTLPKKRFGDPENDNGRTVASKSKWSLNARPNCLTLSAFPRIGSMQWP